MPKTIRDLTVDLVPPKLWEIIQKLAEQLIPDDFKAGNGLNLEIDSLDIFHSLLEKIHFPFETIDGEVSEQYLAEVIKSYVYLTLSLAEYFCQLIALNASQNTDVKQFIENAKNDTDDFGISINFMANLVQCISTALDISEPAVIKGLLQNFLGLSKQDEFFYKLPNYQFVREEFVEKINSVCAQRNLKVGNLNSFTILQLVTILEILNDSDVYIRTYAYRGQGSEAAKRFAARYVLGKNLIELNNSAFSAYNLTTIALWQAALIPLIAIIGKYFPNAVLPFWSAMSIFFLVYLGVAHNNQTREYFYHELVHFLSNNPDGLLGFGSRIDEEQ